jgi:opacity protein-like surface antigen
MKKIFYIIVLAVLSFSTGIAQTSPSTTIGFTPSAYYNFYWNTTFPVGDFHDWVSQPSPAGFGFGGRYIIKNGLTAGFDFGWQRVSKIYDSETYTRPEKGLAITARNYRFTWMVPFQAVVAYHMIPEKSISPYVGLGIGGDYMEHHLMIQEYDIYETFWDFSLTPEVGFLAKFGAFSEWGALVAFNYKWTTNKIELYQRTTENLQMMNLKVGISYLIR